MQIVMIVVLAIKKQIANSTKVVEGLTKFIKDKEDKFSKLMNKVESMTMGESSQAP